MKKQLIISILIFFTFLRDKFGYGYAFGGGILWLLLLGIVLDGGNRVEEYALLFYVLQFFLIFKRGSKKFVRINFLLAGVFAGLGMLLRPNLLSPILSVYLLFFFDFFLTQGKQGKTFDLFRVAFITAVFFILTVIDLFDEKSWKKQLTHLIVLIPFILRVLLIK